MRRSKSNRSRTGTQQGGAALDRTVPTRPSFFLHFKRATSSAPVDVTLAGSTWVKESANVSLKSSGMQTLVVQTTTVTGNTFIVFSLQPCRGRC